MTDNWIPLEDGMPEEGSMIWVYGNDRFVGDLFGLCEFLTVEVGENEHEGAFVSITQTNTKYTWVTHWQKATPPT